MGLRLNRKLLVLILKIIFALIIISFIWFHFKFDRYQTFNQNSEINFIRVLNDSIISKNSHKSIEELRKTIQLINKKQKVLNYETFGPLLANDLVLVIQVHNRIQYLSALIQSLERIKDINTTLVVFSHDLFDPQINSMISSIKFCKVSKNIVNFDPKSETMSL